MAPKRTRKLIAVVGIAGIAVFASYFAYFAYGQTATVPGPVVVSLPQIAPADRQTTAIVAAADGFLASLSDAQKADAMFEFGDAVQRVNWSNFPLGGPGANRKGVKLGDMTDLQRAALTTLLNTVLSPEGAKMGLEQVAADEMVATAAAATAAAAGDTSRPPVSFGSAYYFVSFVGVPSTTAAWMLQFGGHHLAINATVVGSNVTLSPSLTGGQPLKLSYNGEQVYIVEKEAVQAAAMLANFTDDQRKIAIVSTGLGDLVLGPGQDGKTLQPEGLPRNAMNDAQKIQFLGLIQARLGMLNADDLTDKMAAAQKNLDQTTFGWWGPQTPIGAAYFRITGPTLVLEFSPQTNDGDPADHAHNMYRDPTNEYGAAWVSLK